MLPFHLFTSQAPYRGIVKSIQHLTESVCHIVLDHGGKVPFREGQSYGIIPLGENPGTRLPYRLYSIASSRFGDDLSGTTASLCVKQEVYTDPQTGEVSKGICSSYLCSRKPGDQVDIVGPFGRLLLLNEENPSASHIMVSTGTGVAPFRGFMQRLFVKADRVLYKDEFDAFARGNPHNFRCDVALSREKCNAKGHKLYVQDKLKEHGDEILNLLENGSHIYFCGKKDMMEGVQSTFKQVAERKGQDWDETLAELRKRKLWHVEVY